MLTIIYSENPDPVNHSWYKYIIRKNCQEFTAYNTEKWFQDFCNRHNITLEKIEEHIDIYKKKTIIYKSNANIHEKYFTDINQLPPNAKKYTWLCNGSLVDCYYTADTIYRPNPNCKDIYIPLTIKEHIAFQNINW